jgi:fumarate reductase flavoprotein subunit
VSAGEGYDIIVVGAGLAGSVAAAVAAERGRHVLLVDSAPESSAGGNSVLSGGGLHIVRAELCDDPEVLERRIRARALGAVNEEMLAALVAAAAPAFEWFRRSGAQFDPNPPGDIASILAPMVDLTNMRNWRGRGPHVALQSLQSNVLTRGGALRSATSVRELDVAPDGSVRGVVTDGGVRLRSSAVILADGGFQADPELRRRYLGPAADKLFLRGAASGRGTGLRIAEAAGAKLVNMEWFYGHCLHRDVFANDRLWPWPALDEVLTDGAVLVDRHGRRIVDEGKGGVLACNVVARLDDPLSTWVVIDDAVWNATSGREIWGHMPANPELERRGASVLRVAGASELAAATGIDAQSLADELGTYSRAVHSGTTDALPVPRTKPDGALDGALVAFPMVPGITHTMGGPLIDGQAQVLSERGVAIPGLYAAGAGAASPTGGYFGGLANALVFGWLAGNATAKRTQRTPVGGGT